ncbi:MAG: twin-arginine translocase TatA/TatE family subunit [Planctomycetaceae bacterium]
MWGIGTTELLIVGIIALLLFGKRLPEVARSLGKGITEFKKGVAGIEDDVHHATYPTGATSASRPVPRDETQEVTAPKFEPPRFAPGEGEEPKA